MYELAGNDYQGANTVYYTVKEASDVPNFTVASVAGTKTFNITVNGLVEGNTEPVKAKVRIDKGLNETLGITDDQEVKVTVYHHKVDGTVEKLSAVYSNESGLVEFATTSFIPFTIAWEVVNGIPADIPVADVRYAEEYVNVEIPWGSYGQWSPTVGLDNSLEVAFVFKTPHDTEEGNKITDTPSVQVTQFRTLVNYQK